MESVQYGETMRVVDWQRDSSKHHIVTVSGEVGVSDGFEEVVPGVDFSKLISSHLSVRTDSNARVRRYPVYALGLEVGISPSSQSPQHITQSEQERLYTTIWVDMQGQELSVSIEPPLPGIESGLDDMEQETLSEGNRVERKMQIRRIAV